MRISDLSSYVYSSDLYTVDTGLIWTDWRSRDHRGAIVFSEYEHYRIKELHERPYIVIEPTASRKHSNRIPPRHLWTELTQHLQIGSASRGGREGANE